jgi:hypothetical protein
MVVLNIAARWSAPARMLHHPPSIRLIELRHRSLRQKKAHFPFLSQATELIIWQYLTTSRLLAHERSEDKQGNQ